MEHMSHIEEINEASNLLVNKLEFFLDEQGPSNKTENIIFNISDQIENVKKLIKDDVNIIKSNNIILKKRYDPDLKEQTNK